MVHTGVIVKSTMGARDQPPYPLGDATLDSLMSARLPVGVRRVATGGGDAAVACGAS